MSAEVLSRRERERTWVWLEKRSAMRLIWIPSPMMLPSFPSVVPLSCPSCAARPNDLVLHGRTLWAGAVGKGEQMGAGLSRGPEKLGLRRASDPRLSYTVATRAGVSESVFYEIFPTVEECYWAAFEEGLERLSRAVEEAAGAG